MTGILTPGSPAPAAADAAPEDLGGLSVAPASIPARAGEWTFLLRGISPGVLTSVRLRTGVEDCAPEGREITGPASVLYDFALYPQDSLATLELVVAAGTGERAFPIAVSHEPPPLGRAPGVIMLHTRPGTFRWHPWTSKAPPTNLAVPPAELPCTDRNLADLLAATGVSGISKLHPWACDDDSCWIDAKGRVRPNGPGFRSRYFVHFSVQHAPAAFASLFRSCAAVLDAETEGGTSPGVLSVAEEPSARRPPPGGYRPLSPVAAAVDTASRIEALLTSNGALYWVQGDLDPSARAFLSRILRSADRRGCGADTSFAYTARYDLRIWDRKPPLEIRIDRWLRAWRFLRDERREMEYAPGTGCVADSLAALIRRVFPESR